MLLRMMDSQRQFLPESHALNVSHYGGAFCITWLALYGYSTVKEEQNLMIFGKSPNTRKRWGGKHHTLMSSILGKECLQWNVLILSYSKEVRKRDKAHKTQIQFKESIHFCVSTVGALQWWPVRVPKNVGWNLKSCNTQKTLKKGEKIVPRRSLTDWLQFEEKRLTTFIHSRYFHPEDGGERSSETSVYNKPTRRHIPEHGILTNCSSRTTIDEVLFM
jgi:hypothetical protein